MGVGSEVHEAVKLGRRGIGIELKESYFKQAVMNLERVDVDINNQIDMLAHIENEKLISAGLE